MEIESSYKYSFRHSEVKIFAILTLAAAYLKIYSFTDPPVYSFTES